MPPPPTPTAVPGNNTRVTGGIDMALLSRALSPALSKALDALGGREVAQIKDDLSVPVAVGDDGKMIRSSPGDAPRMEFGVLRDNVAHEVVPGDGAVPLPTLRISSSRPPISPSDDPHAAFVLQFELERPYMTFSLVRLKATARDFIGKFFGEKSK